MFGSKTREWIGSFSVPEKEAQQGQSRARVARSRISREGQSLSLALTEASVSCCRRTLQLRTLCVHELRNEYFKNPNISFQIFENNSKVETNIFSRFTLNRSELEQLRTE